MSVDGPKCWSGRSKNSNEWKFKKWKWAVRKSETRRSKTVEVNSHTDRLSLTIICKASVRSRTGWMLLNAELLRRLKFSNKKDNLEARKQVWFKAQAECNTWYLDIKPYLFAKLNMSALVKFANWCSHRLSLNLARDTNSTDLNISGAPVSSCDSEGIEIRLDYCVIIPFNKQVFFGTIRVSRVECNISVSNLNG